MINEELLIPLIVVYIIGVIVFVWSITDDKD